MRKLFSLFAALTLSAGLWAIDNVPYIDANGQPKTANDVTEITNATSQDWWSEGWYVVKGSDVTLSKGAFCDRAVNLILADGAKLTVTGEDGPGIDVSDQYHSLTIYGQANQSGQLIANGDNNAAGIGGGKDHRGYNITINGGTVIANGGDDGAGIGGGRSNYGINITINGGKVIATGGGGGAGIGGGIFSWGEKITINGGIVTVIGGENAFDGIGSGGAGPASHDIFVATSLVVKADNNNNPPTTVRAATRTATTDIASYLADKRYVTVEPKPVPHKGDQFVDTTSVLKFEVTAVGDTNTVKVIKNNYTATSYTVPDTVKYLDVDFAVTEIGKDAFTYCSSLQSVTLSEGLLTIGVSAFEECSSLESIAIPASVTTIGKDAFYNCSSLLSVTLSEGLLTIGVSAFEECSALQTITIPASVTEIGAGAFGSSGLQSITIPAGVTEIGGTAFYDCESLQSVTLSEGLLTIGEAAFQSCVSLQSITIPAGVTTIGSIAFAGSGLQTITIPAGVISLGMGAFAECAGLTSVIFLGNACQDAIGELAFYEVGKDAPALLTLPDNWTGTKPDEDGNWYGGKFELSEDPTALPQTRAAVKATKVMTNSQVIFRAENKNYTILGQEK